VRTFLLSFATLLAVFSQASAQHYRVGRYFPVRADELPGIDPTAVVATVVPDRPRSPETIVPVLAIHKFAGPSHALEGDERLIGAAAPDASLATELFPGRKIIQLPLEPADPLPGPAIAWGVLDAVLLDTAAAVRVSAQQIETLLASGTVVAIRIEAKPGGDWAWQRRGAWWVAQPEGRTVVQIVQPGRYAPADESATGTPIELRRVVIVSLACFAIAVIATSLWRDRRGWVVVVAVSIVCVGVIAWRNARQPTAASIGGEQLVNGPWVDVYAQNVARADGEVRHAITPGVAAAWPILYSPSHARDVGLTLECRADGTPAAFSAHLKRGQSIVFLDRIRTKPGSTTPSPLPATAPAARTRSPPHQ
jgi:hypothetical protein